MLIGMVAQRESLFGDVARDFTYFAMLLLFYGVPFCLLAGLFLLTAVGLRLWGDAQAIRALEHVELLREEPAGDEVHFVD